VSSLGSASIFLRPILIAGHFCRLKFFTSMLSPTVLAEFTAKSLFPGF
jgi:hypothetical protein